MSFAAPSAAERMDRRGVLSWCLFDWANSPFPTVIMTFVIPAYFQQAVVGDVALATTQWGIMHGLAAVVIAVLSPVLGAIADRSGRRKPWLMVTVVVMVVPTALLWFVLPGSGNGLALLWLVAIALVSFELGMVFYNAMLPDLVPEPWIGRVSGWAWGLGYVGGLAGLVLVLYAFVQPETPLFGLDKTTAEHVRAAGPVVALWALVFVVPLLLFTADRPRGDRGLTAVRLGIAGLWQTLRSLRDYRGIGRFLIARMIYTDGINTIFAFGGLYAAGTFGMPLTQVIMFGILLNVTAGVGAFTFGWLDDRIGAKATILLSLVGLVAMGVPLLTVQSVSWFWVWGAGLGLFVGPAQSASRSLMARLAPKGMETEMFGLFAVSGKATAFVGPWLVALLTAQFASQRIGLAIVIPFLVVGGLLLLTVKSDSTAGR
ncbi:MAG: MFS transporter [Alphaproteobacteria bacterium]